MSAVVGLAIGYSCYTIWGFWGWILAIAVAYLVEYRY